MDYIYLPAQANWNDCSPGLLDTITNTAESKDCPGVCVHTLATLICYQVLEDVACPSPSMRCCVDQLPANQTAEEVTARPTGEWYH